MLTHFNFYKEPSTDVTYWPDFQISIGALGFADFWLFGLLLYPFLAGIALRWVYNRAVLTRGLGEAGWLIYAPLVMTMWNPLLLGPDSLQTLRLLIPLAVGLWWTSIAEANDGEDLVRSQVWRSI